MHHTNEPPIALIAVAAAMRAAGEAWETIAQKVGRSADRVRHWPRLYADEWSRHFRAAETDLLADAGTEARQRLRMLLRSEKEWVQLAAAQQMLKARLTERTRELKLAAELRSADNADDRPGTESPEDRALRCFVSVVRKMSDEELNHIISEFLAKQSADASGAPADNPYGDAPRGGERPVLPSGSQSDALAPNDRADEG